MASLERRALYATGDSSDGPAPVRLTEPLLDADQAAALLNVRVSWIREATRSQGLPCLKVGRHLRYTRPMLEAWLDGRAHG